MLTTFMQRLGKSTNIAAAREAQAKHTSSRRIAKKSILVHKDSNASVTGGIPGTPGRKA
jgi:hypothetical protein